MRLAVSLTVLMSISAYGAGRRSWETAVVPPALQQNPAYAEYVRSLIEIDLLANPKTAGLPIQVGSPEAGIIELRGVAPSGRLEQYIIANSRRISGLNVNSAIRVGKVYSDYLVNVSSGELEVLTSETLAGLFPELADNVRTTVTKAGVVVLNGNVPSYEAKLQLSRAIKSQPGCRAVVNLVMVAANPNSGYIAVSTDGRLRLDANRLPIIPAAPLLNLEALSMPEPARRAITQPIAADDAVDEDLIDRQLREEVEAKLTRSDTLRVLPTSIEARFGVVQVAGDKARRENVEAVVESIAQLPDVTKVVAKFSPVSIQRGIPYGRSNDVVESDEEKGRSFGFLKLPFTRSSSSNEPNMNWRFRERIRRNLKRRCSDRADNVQVRKGLERLIIEASTDSARDRNFVFEQVDDITELRSVPYEVVVVTSEE